ncbi:cysteine-rich receptor-like protein kinase 10 [Chenopodium quinoa]|uniref:cysteine-rich receptor-like protein kinase 10 n=1 Tax=Chenopodium quinoa TaxID=63459 RepID=UPI000B77E1DF|nr:cysteine-rich receptor-like protein kinase 10 [Chenopodium quinoa]
MVMLISLTLLLVFQLVIPSSQAFDYFTNCTGSSNYTQNSQYQKNLGNLLAELTAKASLSGFYYTSVGQIPDKVYGLYLCRGGIGSQGCGQCAYVAQGSILKECPIQIWAVLWYDNCMLRFSNESFYHQMDDYPSNVAWNPENITSNETQAFSKVLNNTMMDMTPEIVNSKVKFGTKMASITGSKKLYTLGQCTLDLSADDCGRCLKIAIGKLPMMLGGRALLPSCNVRFEVSPFYGNTVNTSFLLSAIINSTSTVTRDKQQKRLSHIAIAVSIPVIFAILLLAGAFCCIYNRKAATPSPELKEIVTVESLQYDFKTIRVATNNFSTDNKLGQGGFGVVYRVIFLSITSYIFEHI